ncbi:MAG: HEAT repeat domain-containing protein [Simkaniaceae bacterium]
MKLLFLSAFFPLFAHYTPITLSEEGLKRRVEAHLIIEDQKAAYRELIRALKIAPQSLELNQLFIKVASLNGDWDLALKQFELLDQTRFQPHEKRAILENIAWGVILQSENSSQIASHGTSLLGAFFTQDLRGTLAISRALESTNEMIRALAVSCAAKYGDSMLTETFLRMLRKEKSQFVRRALIQAFGELNLKEAAPYLEMLLERNDLDPHDRGLIYQALVRMYETIDEKSLKELFVSKRIFLRVLGCQIVIYLKAYSEIDSLIGLLEDPSLEVRLQALFALTLFPNSELKDKYPQIQQAAGKKPLQSELMTLSMGIRLKDQAARERIKKHLFSSDEKTQRLAAAVLSFSGQNAREDMQMALKKIQDPFAKATLAKGLISQRTKTQKASKVLSQFLSNTHEFIMLDSEGPPLFQTLAPSHLRHTPFMPRYPEFIDHRTRLELYSLLMIVGYKKAEVEIKEFLRGGHFSIGAQAMVTLIEESTTHSLEYLLDFLEDKDPEVQLKAALALALVAKDSRATQTLCQLYKKEDHQTKLMILEALAAIGSEEALPLLIEALKENFHLIRVAAATAIIKSCH